MRSWSTPPDNQRPYGQAKTPAALRSPSWPTAMGYSPITTGMSAHDLQPDDGDVGRGLKPGEPGIPLGRRLGAADGDVGRGLKRPLEPPPGLVVEGAADGDVGRGLKLGTEHSRTSKPTL